LPANASGGVGCPIGITVVIQFLIVPSAEVSPSSRSSNVQNIPTERVQHYPALSICVVIVDGEFDVLTAPCGNPNIGERDSAWRTIPANAGASSTAALPGAADPPR